MATYTKEEAQEWAWENLKGQWTTLITPFTPDDQIDESGLRRNIQHIRKLGTAGAVGTWGRGEFRSRPHPEALQVMQDVADQSRGQGT